MTAKRPVTRTRTAFVRLGPLLRLPGPCGPFLAPEQMTIYNLQMDISVTEFKQHCLEIIRRVERTGSPVAITRRGRVVAQLRRPAPPQAAAAKPWERLRAAGGRLIAPAGESVLAEKDFEALR